MDLYRIAALHDDFWLSNTSCYGKLSLFSTMETSVVVVVVFLFFSRSSSNYFISNQFCVIKGMSGFYHINELVSRDV